MEQSPAPGCPRRSRRCRPLSPPRRSHRPRRHRCPSFPAAAGRAAAARSTCLAATAATGHPVAARSGGATVRTGNAARGAAVGARDTAASCAIGTCRPPRLETPLPPVPPPFAFLRHTLRWTQGGRARGRAVGSGSHSMDGSFPQGLPRGDQGSLRTMKANSENPPAVPRCEPFIRTYRALVLSNVASVTEYGAPAVVL